VQEVLQVQPVNNIPAVGRHNGIGLIEILIAVLVLSIGFLAISALQVQSLANNNSAMMRTQASIAAYSMFDAMRADKGGALAGNYNTTVTVGACPTASGSLAQVQLRNWCFGFDPSLPPPSLWVNGTGNYATNNLPPGVLLGGLAAVGPTASGTINCLGAGAAATAGNCSITITFDDSKATGGSVEQTLLFWTQLRRT
jgi:type IV pilus assembly protein PilV